MNTTYFHMHRALLTDRMLMNQNGYTHVLVIALTAVSDRSRYEFCRELIGNRLCYLMCWGAFAEAWEDSADEAICADPEPVLTTVVTTSHNDETLEEVCWFAKYAAFTANDEPRSLLVLEISEVSEYAGVVEIVRTDLTTAFGA